VGHVLPIAGDLRPHGKGVMVWSDGAKYCGEWKLGKTCGLGHELYGDASVYLGQFQNDLVIYFFFGFGFD